MKKLAIVACVVVAALAFAGEYIGINEYTPTATEQCVTLRRSTNYAVQAVIAAPSYNSTDYLNTSIEVYNTTSSNNTAPDGGIYAPLKSIKLRDTDIYEFNTVGLYTGLCYYANSTADGGVSAMKLRLYEVIK